MEDFNNKKKDIEAEEEQAKLKLDDANAAVKHFQAQYTRLSALEKH